MWRIDHNDQVGLRIRTDPDRSADDQGHGVGTRPGVCVRQDVGQGIGGRAIPETPEPIRDCARRGVRERHGQGPLPEGRRRLKTGHGRNVGVAAEDTVDPVNVRRDARAVKPARVVLRRIGDKREAAAVRLVQSAAVQQRRVKRRTIHRVAVRAVDSVVDARELPHTAVLNEHGSARIPDGKMAFVRASAAVECRIE